MRTASPSDGECFAIHRDHGSLPPRQGEVFSQFPLDRGPALFERSRVGGDLGGALFPPLYRYVRVVQSLPEDDQATSDDFQSARSTAIAGAQ